jgi:hypothetical protein
MNRIYFLIFLLSFHCFNFINGQNKNKGVVEGRVFNSNNNEPVPFASVAIWETNFGTITDSTGYFKFTGVKPGYIELRVSSIGFDPYASEQIMITNADKVYIEVKLKESAQTIQEIVVKASPFRRDIESPLSLINIGIKEIDKNPGGNRDISRVIQSFPGVASTPSFRSDVIVRGGGSSENRFYLDDVEIPNLNHFATQGASGGPVGIFNVDFVREVNFYSGAFPVDRGNALSSVLDFKLIEGNRDKLKVRGTIGASDLALTLDGPLSKNSNYIFSARRSYLQFLFSQLGLPFLPTYNDFQFKTHFNIGNRDEITILGLGAIDISTLNLNANKTEEQRYILKYLPINKQWNYTLGFVYRHFKEHGYDTWVISRNMLNNVQYKYLNNDEIPANKILDYNSFESENKFRYENNSNTIKNLKLIYGADFEYSRYYNSTYRMTFTGLPENYQSNLDFFKWGLFGQVSKEYFAKKLTLSLGMRADANNYSKKMANLLNQLSPRFSVSYALTKKWFLNFNTGKYSELPPYTSLGYRDNSGRLINKENNITYISADHLVTGVEFLPDQNSKVSVEGFYKYYMHYPFSVNDSISLANKGADFGTYGDEEVKSTGIGRAYGMEVLYQNKDIKGADITISYTMVRSEFQNIYGAYIPSAWDNRHILNILFRKDFRRNWDVGFKWRFAGGLPYSPINIAKSELVTAWNAKGQAYIDYTKFNTLRLKPFHQLDIRIDKSYFFNSWSLMAYVDIQNLYNLKADSPPIYIVDETIPVRTNPDRYTLKKLNQTSGGTILPTIGIIVQF